MLNKIELMLIYIATGKIVTECMRHIYGVCVCVHSFKTIIQVTNLAQDSPCNLSRTNID